MQLRFTTRFSIFAICAAILSGCSSLPSGGPSRTNIEQPAAEPRVNGIQIVDVNNAVARQLLQRHSKQTFSDVFGNTNLGALRIGTGDAIEISIWEAPPASLFFLPQADVRGVPATSRPFTLPEQVVSADGMVNVPFAGQIMAAGQTVKQIEAEIVRRLKGKANQPQVFVRLIRNASSNVTVVGEVTTSMRMPLTPQGERLLDALAAAGGVRHPVNKMTLQVTRGANSHAMPLDAIIRDPKQNVPLQAGDVVTALFQSQSFTALGATGKNEEVNFEAQGITLAQALARSGGLIDSRADAQGVFIFRFEPANTLKWPMEPVITTPDGKVPVIYRVDLKDPGSFFVAQTFPIENKDLLYVSNAPVAELQKFLNVVFSITYPLLNAASISK